MPTDYEVGYGRPPKHSRFRKGQSGNPKGRSKGTKDLATDLKEELAERILVREGDSAKRLSKQRAVLKRLFDKSLKGEVGALRILLDLLLRIANDGAAEPSPAPLTAEERELLADLEARLLRRAAPAGASRRHHRRRIGGRGNVSHPLRSFLAAAARTDLPTFVHRAFQTVCPGIPFQANWHVELLADRLDACRKGTIKRLLICLPPRHLKSLCASIAFPAWVLGHDPSRRIICASYSIDLAAKLAGDCRAVLESAWYREAFPTLRLASASELELVTTAKGFRLTTSIGGTLTGRGGDVIVIDDPLKAGDAASEPRRTAVNDWFRNTLYSRLDDKAEGVIIVVTQRLHVDDLIGYLLATGEPWELVQLPAIAVTDERYVLADGTAFTRRAGMALHPERESLEVLEGIRRTLGSYEFAAQYQQEPIPLEGGLIKAHWLRHYATAPDRQSGDLVTQSWDTASKSARLQAWPRAECVPDGHHRGRL